MIAPTINQQKAYTKHLDNKVGALFMKMGTGKTRVALDIINSIEEEIDLLVWIGPLRTIKPPEGVASVKDEIAKWEGFTCQNVIYIGVETIQSSDRQYLQLYHKIRTAWRCAIVVDESIKIKNITAKRTQRLLELGKMAEYKLILNGEPITKSLMDLWAQFQFLSPLILNMSYAEFENTYCKTTTITRYTHGYGRSYSKKFITGYENIDHLYSLIGEYVYECDLELNVQRIFEERYYQLSEEAEESYQYLKTKYLDDKMLQIKNNNIFLELTMKMQHQYCCEESKIEQVKEWLSDKKQSETIFFCKYIASQHKCKQEFPEALVLSYQSNAFGLNLQHLPNMVMFDKTFDWGLVQQAMARNFRTNSWQDVRVLKLTGNVGLETLIDENNKKKLCTAEYLKTISREQLKEVL